MVSAPRYFELPSLFCMYSHYDETLAAVAYDPQLIREVLDRKSCN